MFGSNKPARTVKYVQDSSGAPAVNLTKVREAGHEDLFTKASKAGISLSKRGLAGIRAQAVLVLDYSGSMRSDYGNGNVQTLVERALGFSLQIDIDGSVPVIPFGSSVLPTIDVDLNNYQDVVNRELVSKYSMGTTNLAGALKVVLELAKETNDPIFCVVVTDGAPDSESEATKVIAELSKYPVFVKFLALEDVYYLRQLDKNTKGKSLIDNVNAQFSGHPHNLLTCSDLNFADAMVAEWDLWVKAATAAGILN